eukprot:1161553-Pelagomonas_calceolata.AAC.9
MAGSNVGEDDCASRTAASGACALSTQMLAKDVMAGVRGAAASKMMGKMEGSCSSLHHEQARAST